MTEKCVVCGAGVGQRCVDPINGGPRDTHVGRSERSYCNQCGMAQPVNHDCGRTR